MTAAGRYLFEVQARAERATPGPWQPLRARDQDDPGNAVTAEGITETPVVAVDAGCPSLVDATFIAAARTDVPRLVAALRAALDVANDLHSAPGITDRRTVAEVLRDRIERELTP